MNAPHILHKPEKTNPVLTIQLLIESSPWKYASFATAPAFEIAEATLPIGRTTVENMVKNQLGSLPYFQQLKRRHKKWCSKIGVARAT